VTPDELGEHWKDGLVHHALNIDYNGEPFGRPLAHKDATFSLARLVSHAAKTRPLTAGTIVGSGTVSNKGADGSPGKPVAEGGLGYSCIAEIRMIEKIATGEFVTPFMSLGDTVKIEMFNENGQSIFGSIENEVKAV
jgi:fumarylacetoacetate (FAA) hydrolase